MGLFPTFWVEGTGTFDNYKADGITYLTSNGQTPWPGNQYAFDMGGPPMMWESHVVGSEEPSVHYMYAADTNIEALIGVLDQNNQQEISLYLQFEFPGELVMFAEDSEHPPFLELLCD